MDGPTGSRYILSIRWSTALARFPEIGRSVVRFIAIINIALTSQAREEDAMDRRFPQCPPTEIFFS